MNTSSAKGARIFGPYVVLKLRPTQTGNYAKSSWFVYSTLNDSLISRHERIEEAEAAAFSLQTIDKLNAARSTKLGADEGGEQ